MHSSSLPPSMRLPPARVLPPAEPPKPSPAAHGAASPAHSPSSTSSTSPRAPELLTRGIPGLPAQPPPQRSNGNATTTSRAAGNPARPLGRFAVSKQRKPSTTTHRDDDDDTADEDSAQIAGTGQGRIVPTQTSHDSGGGQHGRDERDAPHGDTAHADLVDKVRQSARQGGAPVTPQIAAIFARLARDTTPRAGEEAGRDWTLAKVRDYLVGTPFAKPALGAPTHIERSINQLTPLLVLTAMRQRTEAQKRRAQSIAGSVQRATAERSTLAPRRDF